MRVLHVYSGNLYGGVERLLSTLWRQRALCTDMSPGFALAFDGRLRRELEEMGCHPSSLGNVRARYPLTVLRARRTLAALLRRDAFDVALCHGPWAQAIFAPVIRGLGIPQVLWLHSSLEPKHWVERWARRTPPDLVLANSRFTAAAGGTMYPHVNTEVVYCPVDALGPGPGSTRRALRAAHSVPDAAVIIIHPSRLEPLKGHRLLLDALGMLGRVPRWEAWIVGGPQRRGEASYLRSLRRRAARLGIAHRVTFLGQRSDVPELLAAADILCQPNEGPEAFGITFVEGLLAGIPVVSTRMGAATEILDDSCGVLVPPADPPALAAALERLIHDAGLRTRLGAGGPARARALSDPATALARLRDVLAGVVEARAVSNGDRA